MLRITDFCSCIYVLGCKLSVVRLCDSDFGITTVDDITIGITCAAFCFHMAHISLLLLLSNMLAYSCQMEILVTLAYLMLTINVAPVRLLDVLRWQMPSTVMPIYSMDVRSRLV